ncbi:hypothetical protein CAEBREN_00728 [Caenorhabditis brenneri]|uniref:Uncharacterized protein n=1 Tax=Caenorhabditis brenneri TaxID=135651 RepID=G0MJP1_CAEBE|nr:hypothetical protein CAEBREN_00728 [Caenorhabditis brenneri]
MSGIVKKARSCQKTVYFLPSTSAATPDKPSSKFDDLLRSVQKIEADQTSYNKTVIENLNALKMEMETLVAASESTPNEGNERKRKREDIEESAESSSKKKDAPAEQKQIVPQKPIPAKSLVLKHDFHKISDLKEGNNVRTPTEEHFGVTW